MSSESAAQSAEEYWSNAFKTRFPLTPATPRISAQTAAELGLTWDAEFDALSRLLLQAKLRRNETVAPIYVLPPEILSRIFEYTKSACELLADERFAIHETKPWAWVRAVTHVCQRFRSVAIANSSLWTDLHTVKGLWDVFLSRSKEYPLNINGTLAFDYHSHLDSQLYDVSPRYISNIHDNLARLRSLDITTLKKGDIERLVVALDAGSPVLLTLILAVSGGHHPLNDKAETTLHKFISSSPNIKKLEFSGIGTSYPWTAATLRMITSLSLNAGTHYNRRRLDIAPVTSSITFTFDDVLEGLRTMPMLEFLSILHVLPPVPTNMRVSRQPVSLSRLSSLQLTSFDGCSAYLWSLLETPSHAPVTLTNLACDWEFVLEHLTQKLKALFNHVEAPKFDAFEVGTPEESDFNPDTLLQFTVSCGEIEDAWQYSFDGLPEPPTVRISARYARADWLGTDAPIFPHLRALFPSTTSVRYIRLGNLTLDAGDFLEIYGRDAEVQSVRFDSGQGSTICALLDLLAANENNATVASAPANVFLPSLSSIKFSHRDMGHNDMSEVWTRLRSSVRARSASGYPVKSVTLDGCALPIDWYWEWNHDKSMPKLEWDYDQGAYRDSDSDEE
ncbi:hypothetical protein PENSPDRAFT_732132 [Peniophora sp. CONT]|nr:hypothetical protein PENSPDRAFT_732132 [Peniophora sp. CONT]